MSKNGEKMMAEGFEILIDIVKAIIDYFKVMIDAIQLFIDEMCIKFIALWIELINYQEKKEIDIQRIVSLISILYVICFIDLDFIPIFGKIDDLIVIHYSHRYCCDQKQTIMATELYQKYKTYIKITAIIWMLY